MNGLFTATTHDIIVSIDLIVRLTTVRLLAQWTADGSCGGVFPVLP
jgi:hypothetical protein